MRSVEVHVVVEKDGALKVSAPASTDLPPGRHEGVLVIDDSPAQESAGGQPPAPDTGLEFPVDDCGPWPKNLSLRREDIYHDRVR